MSEQRDWSDYAVQDWIKMQHDNAIDNAEMDKDLQHLPDEQVAEYFERSAALESALQAWRMG